MKKNYLFLLLFIVTQTPLLAQKFSYGVVLGANYFNEITRASGPQNASFDSGHGEFVVPDLGVYGEWQLGRNLGVKMSVTHNRKGLDWSYNGNHTHYKLTYIDINPNLKWDFGSEYRKGFYLLLGPRVAVLQKAEEGKVAVNHVFEQSYLAVDFGFGQRIAKIFELEAKVDYGITPFYKLHGSEPNKMIGGYMSLNVDVERIIHYKRYSAVKAQ